jgi:hypothetical protein
MPRHIRQVASEAQVSAWVQQRASRHVVQVGSGSAMPQLRGPASGAGVSVRVELVVVVGPPPFCWMGGLEAQATVADSEAPRRSGGRPRMGAIIRHAEVEPGDDPW